MVEGGKYDDNGFYILADGGKYDPDGVLFNRDEFGGYYDQNLCYHPGKLYQDLFNSIRIDNYLLDMYGFIDDEEEEEEEEEEEKEEEEPDGIEDDHQWEDYLEKEKIIPTLKYIKSNPQECLLVSVGS